jgi:hypothetical protein
MSQSKRNVDWKNNLRTAIRLEDNNTSALEEDEEPLIVDFYYCTMY